MLAVEELRKRIYIIASSFNLYMVTSLKAQSKTTLPTRHGIFETIAYSKDKDEKMPHMVLINPATDLSEVVNVRIHSECMTGDVFGSRRCECGEQLEKSMEFIGKQGGVLIYLRQEGRGIGIINKLDAYTKQDEGFDTAEANKLLGFGYDDRTYEDAQTILNDFNVTLVNLLTNNPEKIKGINNYNIKVVDRIPIQIPFNEDNEGYLKTKKDFFGHFL